MWTIAALYLFLLQSPESEHRRALDLAAAGNVEQAKAILVTEQEKNPGDKRFPIELAAIGFKAGNYREARRHIHRALRIDPDDVYANDFVATVYLLQNNTESADLTSRMFRLIRRFRSIRFFGTDRLHFPRQAF